MKTLPKHAPATQAYIRTLSAVLTGNNSNYRQAMNEMQMRLARRIF